jgi:hypothetical protein
MLHQHRDSKGAVFGYPHPMEFNHEKQTTQCKHLRSLAEINFVSWTFAVEQIKLILSKEKKEIRKIKRCPECGIGKKGVDSLCDSCYKEYLGTHAGARGED